MRSIDPAASRVTTDAGTFEADVLIVALGADLDPAATPGLVEGGNEFYSVAGAVAIARRAPADSSGAGHRRRLREILQVSSRSQRGGVAASRLSDRPRLARGDRISLAMPFGMPIPPRRRHRGRSSRVRGARHHVRQGQPRLALDPGRKVAVLSDGTEMPYALFLGVPVHRVPQVVVDSGLADAPYDWVPVNKTTLETSVPRVYAVGDVNGVGTPKAGVFAEGAARVVAGSHHRPAPWRADTGAPTRDRAPATSSSATARLGGWTSTF